MRSARRPLRVVLRRWALCLLPILWLGGAQAQTSGETAQAPVISVRSPVLVLDFDRLFAQSRFGLRVLRDIEAESRALIEENNRIEAELSEEERMLTERRAELPPEEFRDLADAFDDKVQQLRATQQAKAESVGDNRDEEERRFRQLVTPIIARIMQDAGAVVVLDRRDSIVWVEAIGITDTVLRLADRVIGEGIETPPPGGAAPEAPPAPPAPVAPPPTEPGAETPSEASPEGESGGDTGAPQTDAVTLPEVTPQGPSPRDAAPVTDDGQ